MADKLTAVCASAADNGTEKTLATNNADVSDRHGLLKNVNECVGLCMLHSSCRLN
jgi:hypothetical protein